MTTDIKERLRVKAAWMEEVDFVICAKLYRDAADYIEQLEGQTAEPVAWMTDDGRVSLAQTKDTAMPSQVAVSFNIPLFTHPDKTEQPSLSDAEILRHFSKYWEHQWRGPQAYARILQDELVRGVRALLSAQRQDSDTPAISEQCVSSSGPIGCYRVRCHLGKVCAAIANGAPK